MLEKTIASILGVFKAGPEGAGGDYQPMDTIGEYVFNLYRHVIYGLKFKEGFDKQTSVIIDAVYDGITIKDPHSQTPMQFVTNYPGDGAWFGWFEPPKLTQCSAPGKHVVVLKVAPRKLLQYFRGRDFSPEAGGVISAPLIFEILPQVGASS